ncbi:MAG: hypothetical protein Q8Q60_03800 [Candidatus Chromulinivorax sp.]|nr:hypothetical protein [Candidatus Chromulinivorax sp.]
MHYRQEQLLQYLDSDQIAYQLYTHPQFFTCEQAEEIVKQMQMR